MGGRAGAVLKTRIDRTRDARVAATTQLRAECLRAVRGLDDYDIVVMTGVPLQALAPHPDLVAHELVSELERFQPIG